MCTKVVLPCKPKADLSTSIYPIEGWPLGTQPTQVTCSSIHTEIDVLYVIMYLGR